MATATIKKAPSPLWNMSRLRRHLCMIPAHRILLFPYNGPATPDDLLYLHDHHDVICELFDGILVRKPMVTGDSILACILGSRIVNYLETNDLGTVFGEAGFLELLPGQIRAPDVTFISWDQFPARKLPKKRIPAVHPDLAVEILSYSNTPKEMARKRRECFAQGTQLFWQVDPKTKTVEVFTSPTESKDFRVGQTLDGGEVLPGFKLKVSEIFED